MAEYHQAAVGFGQIHAARTQFQALEYGTKNAVRWGGSQKVKTEEKTKMKDRKSVV
jgi:hypothetical protein